MPSSLTNVDVPGESLVPTSLKCVSVITLEPFEIQGFRGSLFHLM